MYHHIGIIQMKNYLLIVLGLIIATIGFAFAFSSPDTSYTDNLLRGDWQYLLTAFPNLFTGIIIGLGGVAIAITGELYRIRLDRRESLVCSCGKTLQKTDKFCPQCGNEIK